MSSVKENHLWTKGQWSQIFCCVYWW